MVQGSIRHFEYGSHNEYCMAHAIEGRPVLPGMLMLAVAVERALNNHELPVVLNDFQWQSPAECCPQGGWLLSETAGNTILISHVGAHDIHANNNIAALKCQYNNANNLRVGLESSLEPLTVDLVRQLLDAPEGAELYALLESRHGKPWWTQNPSPSQNNWIGQCRQFPLPPKRFLSD